MIGKTRTGDGATRRKGKILSQKRVSYKSGIVLTQSARLVTAKLKAKTEGTLRKALIMGERTVVIKAMFFTTELTEENLESWESAVSIRAIKAVSRSLSRHS